MNRAPLSILNAEVSDMKNVDPIWQAFSRTGDPLYYLLYRASRTEKKPEKTKEEGETPQAQD